MWKILVSITFVLKVGCCAAMICASVGDAMQGLVFPGWFQLLFPTHSASRVWDHLAQGSRLPSGSVWISESRLCLYCIMLLCVSCFIFVFRSLVVSVGGVVSFSFTKDFHLCLITFQPVCLIKLLLFPFLCQTVFVTLVYQRSLYFVSLV